MPLDSSIAVITKIPSTSTENLTVTLGIPAGLGSKPAKINSPKCVLFSDVSLSPWRILIFMLSGHFQM